eukprot:1158402-Pyramimonas_sp.AAC.1
MHCNALQCRITSKSEHHATQHLCNTYVKQPSSSANKRKEQCEVNVNSMPRIPLSPSIPAEFVVKPWGITHAP